MSGNKNLQSISNQLNLQLSDTYSKLVSIFFFFFYMTGIWPMTILIDNFATSSWLWNSNNMFIFIISIYKRNYLYIKNVLPQIIIM